MKVINNSLTPVIDRWSDPGDYPSGAGSCALPSYDYIEYYDGTVEIKLEAADWKEIYDYADIDMTDLKMIEAWLRDDPGKVDHGESGLKVKSWYVEFVKGDRIVLSVDEFDAELPEPDYDESDL
jgi:hypothetical protein